MQRRTGRGWCRWTARAGAFVASVAFGHGAYAQEDVATREATARFREGLHLHDGGQDEEARLKFAQAYAVLHTPNILFNLARSEQLTAHHLEALDHYKQYVRSEDPKITPKDREAARLLIAQLVLRVGHVRIEAPVGAKVVVDGTGVAGECPFPEPLDVAVGTHAIVAKIGEATKTVTIAPGEGETVVATFVFEQSAPVPTKPPPDHVPPPPKPVTTEPSNGAKIGTTIALAGGAAVGLGVGIYLFTDATRADHEAISLLHGAGCLGVTSPTCTRASQLQSRNTLDTVGGSVGVAVGGALLVGAVLVPFLWPKSATQSSWLAPSFLPGGGAVEFGGRF